MVASEIGTGSFFGRLPRMGRAVSRMIYRNGHSEPLLHRFADGAVGMALFEQIESAVQQLYCKGIFVYGAACVFKCAV